MTADAIRRRNSLPTGHGLGATIGQYRVTGVIGRGGMGAVYAAEHMLLGRPAAIKVLLADLSQRQDIVLRFFNEARAAAAIRHPGIVEIYDVGWSADGSAYIVMEHLRGETLARRAARGRLPWQVAFALARQVAGALAVAHGKGIVHRDLKPDNLFLVPDPEVPGGERIKLLDFGIAKLIDGHDGARMTRTGVVMGTPTYMAPEQCRGVAVDHRADLYALGCLVFKLCAGRAPFVGAGPGDVLASHIHNPPPLLGSLVPEISPQAEAVIQRLLAKRAEDRTPSAEALIQDIDAATRAAARAERPRGTSRKASVAAPAAPADQADPVTATTEATTEAGSAATTTGASALTIRDRRGRKPVLWLSAAIAATSIVASISVATCEGPAIPADSRAPGGLQITAAAAPPAAAALPREVVRPAAHPDAAAAARDQAAVASEPAAPSPPGEPAPGDTVEVAIDSVPAGAEVVLGDTVLGRTPFRGTIARGDASVTFVLRLSGYARKQVVARADKPIAQKVALVGLARPAPHDDRDVSVNPFAR